ncbi:MAG: glycerophosphodiester phosphodiesterase [Lachnospiraceae bacterium]|nr:glycerophosphodiester phosphodiesterase [Lachnospiraceae bacterium]
MEYIRLAAGLPVDALEVDVRMSPEGVLVLTHDPAADRQPVTMEEAFTFLSEKNVLINCDLKEYGLEDAVAACAKKCGVAEERLIFTGSVTDCRNFRLTHPLTRVFINAEELIPDFYMSMADEATRETAVSGLAEACMSAGYDVININYRALCDTALSALKDAGISISAWTVDDGENMKRMAAAGVINMTTNCPILAAEILEKATGRNK